MCIFIVNPFSDNPGQNVLGHLRKLGTKTHFAKLTHILPLKKAWGCCYKGLFLLSPSPPSSVDCVELKLECITSTLYRGGRGEGRCLNLTSYCVSVPRVLTRVVDMLTLSLKKLWIIVVPLSLTVNVLRCHLWSYEVVVIVKVVISHYFRHFSRP